MPGQLVTLDTRLITYKDHYVHLTGRDADPGWRGIELATKIVDRLDEDGYIKKADLDKAVRTNLSGIWFDCRSANVNIYLVTELDRYLVKDAPNPLSILEALVKQTIGAIKTARDQEDGQSINGCLAQFIYTGGEDYDHRQHKFTGRSGLYSGLMSIEDGDLAPFRHTASNLAIPIASPMYKDCDSRVLDHDDLHKELKNPPRGRYGVGDAISWGLIRPEDISKIFEDEKKIRIIH